VPLRPTPPPGRRALPFAERFPTIETFSPRWRRKTPPGSKKSPPGGKFDPLCPSLIGIRARHHHTRFWPTGPRTGHFPTSVRSVMPVPDQHPAFPFCDANQNDFSLCDVTDARRSTCAEASQARGRPRQLAQISGPFRDQFRMNRRFGRDVCECRPIHGGSLTWSRSFSPDQQQRHLERAGPGRFQSTKHRRIQAPQPEPS